MRPDDYIRSVLAHGLFRGAHLLELVRHWQETHGLDADGKPGPITRSSIEHAIRARTESARTPAPPIDPHVVDGWLVGSRVSIVAMHPSWRYDRLRTPDSRPRAIVCHYTATDPGTGLAMARRRQSPRVSTDRAASWHVTIETDGQVIQMAPLTVGCWHAGGPSAQPIPEVGPANQTAIGIELVGHGDDWPEPQVAAACDVWRAIVSEYRIRRELAMVAHSALDPGRRADPGETWLRDHAPRVLAVAYG